ncbi:hypothetical protein AGMMS50229_01670 [Campylobacterota bacterium]|nr:hypothetical protein AGMMS50229_01670 [Campylobacterota bacterium]
MNTQAIHHYRTEVEKLKHFSGTTKETSIRNAFYNLLNEYAKPQGLTLVAEISVKAAKGNLVTPDGTLKDALRQDWGYWESKDENDNINEEIQKKFDKGYPKDNILFEDSQTAILIQNGAEVMRVSFSDDGALHRLLTAFISFERPEVQNFRKAIELFKEDVPKVTETIRHSIVQAQTSNTEFIKAAKDFLDICRKSINPHITTDDVREMIVQHILTEDIFNTIFDETQFHEENNIAKEIRGIVKTFFTGSTKRLTIDRIKHYYDVIKAAASTIIDHHEKQKFLKVLYENFYKSYNPKAADRLGVVYTPNEIVRFMIESTDYLLGEHFGKYLEDKDVEILDPATGTGTFICDLIDYIRKEKIEYKYKNEIHANEVAILPYYISNLNIEFTYKQKMGQYAEFANLCFVDTLDNSGFLYRGKQTTFDFSEENTERIRKQNDKKISVIIGNPPYNANQANENDNNKNREYTEIDERIKATFIKQSTAQKTKVYDMYARFYRWAFDRLDKNGIVAFVTNRSFIDSRTFDGFRKTIQQEFEAAYIIDTKSDVRINTKISGTAHNVFGIQTGIAIMFLIKKQERENRSCKIHYIALNDFWKKEEKLQWLSESRLQKIPFEIIRPDKNNNWIGIADTDFATLLQLISKNNSEKSLFDHVSMGISTNRDEWVYDFNQTTLKRKIDFFVRNYSKLMSKKHKTFPTTIKWSRDLKTKFSNKRNIVADNDQIIRSFYRPFVKTYFFANKVLVDRLTGNHISFFGESFDKHNCLININHSSSKDFNVLGTNALVDLHYNGDANCLPLYRYDQEGNRIDNITDWGLNQFVEYYGDRTITKEAVFHYVYAVLHNHAYRIKYELNLKREFPRIPFYDDFYKWSKWGEKLMDLHINYETVEPFALRTIEAPEIKSLPKVKLKANKEAGAIAIDENTTLSAIPAQAWNYKLGNRSALEWVLDQYKERSPKDPTIAEQFNSYRFADYKTLVIDLLKRVCTVSVETMKIVDEMAALSEKEATF